MQTEDKMVTHPDHYMSETGLETIDVIKAFTADLVGVESFYTGNILKYMCRWKRKNGLQDLEKAQWYLEHLIDHIKDCITKGGKKKTADEKTSYCMYVSGDENHVLNILDTLRNEIKLKGYVSYADACWINGDTAPFGSDRLGWTSLGDSGIIRITQGMYMLVLPPYLPLPDEILYKKNVEENE